ncbi:50S ribosomal protein L21e [Candidatus Marsarchaeota G2 archaeon OSP_D]|jgi:Ribosomal protein L21E|uniref:Large ribosomal subunit protein eL21 n=4 Tax=Candidatus Marsarchaeota group 2 TaxID=2203771 RepID=A0A2R6CB49_9ARCH|nr:MAG: 50S ribosomal protein L21e [Candidatus Marsarchaeota G2 archaeon ECH_B_SAG-M15]PSN90296.1 MAG: 50S ribosomal protein L21e [Candidatus Marsarchaeota G2 archaeon OSP_D]PSN96962.1 MAG: 50S ribosomal protein L21e [Candidatus Marsarchaeota G2 archaeon ECH_B_SAG-C16]PSO08060.1 MAG: 50S ribosomal protein L21e [Candidatus Marsarchaeota G2 archaeon BE_D]
MTRNKGYRNKSRSLLTKAPRESGLPPPSAFIKEFGVGSKVVIDIEPSVQKGMPHRRYQGKIGTIVEKRGRAYVVKVPMEPEDRVIVVRPVHIKPFG